jgi:UDP-N-acetylglucosamine:LPS N-acetylglucosamine transferase
MTHGPRILFQSHNRRGLGHLMRALNLAREIRALEPGADILVHARNPSARSFCAPHAECVVEDASTGARGWRETARAFAPDVVVYDTMLPKAPADEPLARRAYVMRKCVPERQQEIFADPFLATVDVALIPHSPAEFGYELPPALAPRCVFTGPIVRAPDPTLHDALRRRHGLEPGRFTLLSTAGGGGFAATAGPFFDAVWTAHARVAERHPDLRHVVVLGPHRDAAPAPLPGMSVVQAEPELVTLFTLADLVVSEGGYNSVNEIRLTKTPAVFVPGTRRYDDQRERVDELAALGLAVVADGTPGAVAARIADVAAAPEALRAMRERYAADRVDAGNRRAAAAILGVADRAHGPSTGRVAGAAA